MGNDLALNSDRTSLPEPFGPVRGEGVHWNDRPASADGFTFEKIVLVLREHWKLVLASMVAGVAAAIIVTLLTTPLYRARVVLEVNPPTVEILDDGKGTSANSIVGLWDLIATQVGLLKSQSLGERVAQDLNLASNPNFLSQTGDAASHLKEGGAKVAGGVQSDT